MYLKFNFSYEVLVARDSDHDHDSRSANIKIEEHLDFENDKSMHSWANLIYDMAEYRPCRNCTMVVELSDTLRRSGENGVAFLGKSLSKYQHDLSPENLKDVFMGIVSEVRITIDKYKRI